MSRDPSQVGNVGGVYAIGRKLGAGSFGDIYLATHTETGEEFAAKFENVKAQHPMLLSEARRIKSLQGVPGIASVRHCDTEGDWNVCVMDLLGPSLEDLFNICHRRFSLKTVLMLADQMLYRIEYVHSKNFIHRDIKPDNFLVGHGEMSNIVYIIDFGLAKRYRDWKTMQHIPFREGKSLTGTARYASINAHLGVEQSRRDDLEAIGYVLMYFNRGELPWQGLQAKTKDEKYNKIMECKRSTSVDTLCKGFPTIFVAYLNYCRALRFEDRPDYPYLRRLFKDLFMREAFVSDGMFDWSSPGTQGNGDALTASARAGGVGGPGAVEDAGRPDGGGGASDDDACRGLGSMIIEARPTMMSSQANMASCSLRNASTMDASPEAKGHGEDAARGKGQPGDRIFEERPRPRRSVFASIFGCWGRGAVRR
mmetsp:Transcript_26926/g.78094  ORF Transcript_26926/g.78094 Transcript_26926/m.78094 type:complete len:424 (+) Transcript_26926:62-1333(+)